MQNSIGTSVDCSGKAYLDEFNREMDLCLSREPIAQAMDGGVGCVGIAALSTIKSMNDRCQDKPGPVDCTPSGYWMAYVKELDPQKKAIDIVISTLQNFAIAGGGCLVGGLVGGGVGAALTFPIFEVGGALGFAQGCRAGAIAAPILWNGYKISMKTEEDDNVTEMTSLILNDGKFSRVKKIQKNEKRAETIQGIYEILKSHSRACGVSANLPTTLSVENHSSVNLSATQLYLNAFQGEFDRCLQHHSIHLARDDASVVVVGAKALQQMHEQSRPLQGSVDFIGTDYIAALVKKIDPDKRVVKFVIKKIQKSTFEMITSAERTNCIIFGAVDTKFSPLLPNSAFSGITNFGKGFVLAEKTYNSYKIIVQVNRKIQTSTQMNHLLQRQNTACQALPNFQLPRQPLSALPPLKLPCVKEPLIKQKIILPVLTEESECEEYEKYTVELEKEENQSLKARDSYVNVSVPLDHLSQTTTSVTIPINPSTSIGATIPLSSPKNASVNVLTTVADTQIGGTVNPSNLKGSSAFLSRNLGGGASLGLGMNPLQPGKTTQISGSVNTGYCSVGGSLNVRNPKTSVVSVSVPVYGIPVGISAPLNKIHEANVTIGYSGTPLMVSISVKKLFKNPKKALSFWKRKKHKKHHHHVRSNSVEITGAEKEFRETIAKVIEEMRKVDISSNALQQEIIIGFKNSEALVRAIGKVDAALQQLSAQRELLDHQIQRIQQGPSLAQLASDITINHQALSIQTEELQQKAPRLVAALQNKITPEEAARLRARLLSFNNNHS